MKIFIFLLFVSLFRCMAVFGQKEARPQLDTMAPYTFITHPRHCVATRIGEGMMIAGGVILIAGAWAGSTDVNKRTIEIASAGGIIAGAVVFICGKRFEYMHKKQFALITRGNQVGLAYDF